MKAGLLLIGCAVLSPCLFAAQELITDADFNYESSTGRIKVNVSGTLNWDQWSNVQEGRSLGKADRQGMRDPNMRVERWRNMQPVRLLHLGRRHYLQEAHAEHMVEKWHYQLEQLWKLPGILPEIRMLRAPMALDLFGKLVRWPIRGSAPSG
jgi:hypothetical protein